MDVRELYNALQLAFCCIISCIRERCIASHRRWCGSLRSCRRSCRRTLLAFWSMLLPLGDGHRRAERPGCCCCRASTSSLRRGATLGSRLCSTSSAAALSVYDMGNVGQRRCCNSCAATQFGQLHLCLLHWRPCCAFNWPSLWLHQRAAASHFQAALDKLPPAGSRSGL